MPAVGEAASEFSGKACGVLNNMGIVLRGVFFIDPHGVVQFASTYNLNVVATPRN